MASKTELNNIIKQKERIINNLTTLNDRLNKKVKDESDKANRILAIYNELMAKVKESQNIKWYQFWK